MDSIAPWECGGSSRYIHINRIFHFKWDFLDRWWSSSWLRRSFLQLHIQKRMSHEFQRVTRAWSNSEPEMGSIDWTHSMMWRLFRWGKGDQYCWLKKWYFLWISKGKKIIIHTIWWFEKYYTLLQGTISILHCSGEPLG